MPASRPAEAHFFGHPPGLAVCFLTEMWERFSYYGMRALLIFYLTRHFLFSDQVAAGIFGAYISLVYITPVIGGVLADRYLGPGRAVIIGAVLLVAGHFGMAIEGAPAVSADERDPVFLQIFYLSLSLIIVGVGFIKANISTIVGSLYQRQDPRRDSGYTLFYMGINLGAFLGAIVCGLLLEYKGFAWGFGAAGVGMLLGLVVFLRGRPLLQGVDAAANPELLRAKTRWGISVQSSIYVGTAIAILLICQLLQVYTLVGGLLLVFLAAMLITVISHALFQCEPIDRDRILVCLFLMSYQVLFWALFEQAGSSLNLLTDRYVERSVFGYQVPAATFQSANAFFIILLAPLFNLVWLSLGRRGHEPSIPAKFALALVLVGVGYLLLVMGAKTGGGASIALIWLLLLYLLHTMGELCLSPIGLSMTSKLSTPRIVGMMMGCWFLAMATGNYVSGVIAGLTGSGALSGAEAMAGYLDVYLIAGILSVGAGILALMLVPLLRRFMHGVH